MRESHLAASRQEVEAAAAAVHNSSPCGVSLRETSIFELREELQLRALRLSVARASFSPKSFTMAGTEIASTRSDVDPWCPRRCAPHHRRSQKLSQSEMRRHIQHARHRRSSHEDPVARHESKPSCRHVVNHTSRHAACKTHTAQFCGPLLSVPLSASGLLTESGARYAAGLYVRLQRTQGTWSGPPSAFRGRSGRHHQSDISNCRNPSAVLLSRINQSRAVAQATAVTRRVSRSPPLARHVKGQGIHCATGASREGVWSIATAACRQ